MLKPVGDSFSGIEDVQNAAVVTLVARIADISGANSDFVVSPVDGVVKRIDGVVSGDTGGATVITASNGSTTIGTISIANGSSAGEVDSNTTIQPNAGKVSAGDAIKILSNGGAVNAVSERVTITIQRLSV